MCFCTGGFYLYTTGTDDTLNVECSDSEKNMSAFADQNHAPSLTCVRLECAITIQEFLNQKISEGISIYLGGFYFEI